VKPSFEMPTDTITDRLNVDLMHNF